MKDRSAKSDDECLPNEISDIAKNKTHCQPKKQWCSHCLRVLTLGNSDWKT